MDHPKLSGLDLTNSVVLEVITDDESLTLEMEFALAEGHPRYVASPADADGNFRQGFMRFSDIDELQIDKTPENASENPDYGVFHAIEADGHRYQISCGWGEIMVMARSFRVALDN